jgi:hypothetical protein
MLGFGQVRIRLSPFLCPRNEFRIQFQLVGKGFVRFCALIACWHFSLQRDFRTSSPNTQVDLDFRLHHASRQLQLIQDGAGRRVWN